MILASIGWIAPWVKMKSILPPFLPAAIFFATLKLWTVKPGSDQPALPDGGDDGVGHLRVEVAAEELREIGGVLRAFGEDHCHCKVPISIIQQQTA